MTDRHTPIDPSARAEQAIRKGAADDPSAHDARHLAEALVSRHAGASRASANFPDAETLARADSSAVSFIAHNVPELATAQLLNATKHQREFLQKHEDRLLARIAAGRILESAISLSSDDVRIEGRTGMCITVRRQGTPGDVCVELIGLSVELLAAGRVDAAEALIAHYAGEADDFSLYELANYYEFSTALARAASAARGVVSIHDDRARTTALDAARRLVSIALASDRRTARPAFVIAVGGQVASGKSTLARELADRICVPRVIADRVRDQLLYGVPGRDVHESHWARSFDPGFHERVYAELAQRAEKALASGRSVVLDGCFSRVRDRAAVRALARRHDVPFRFVELRINDATRRERLAMRDAEDAGGGWAEIARTLADDWEAPDELLEEEHCLLDGGRPLEESAERVLEGLPAWPDPSLPGAPVPSQRRPLPHPPRAVTFDCWQTLIHEADWERAHAYRVNALLRAAREAGRHTSTSEASLAFDAGWKYQMACWRDGIHADARGVAIHALRELDLLEPHPALEHLIFEYEEASHSGRVLSVDGAKETLATLSKEGVRCALICDTGLTPGRVVRRHLERLELLEYLEVCIFSNEVGAPKPDSLVFHAALDPLGVHPNAAVHVGDLRRTDVAGARAVGMGTIRIRAQHDDESGLPDADAVVDSHTELIAMLL